MPRDNAAAAQILNFEQYLIAQLLYADAPDTAEIPPDPKDPDQSLRYLPEKIWQLRASAIRNRGNSRTKLFGESVRDIVSDLELQFPDGDDPKWQKAVQYSQVFSGLESEGQNINAYSGGKTGRMEPVDPSITKFVSGHKFYVESQKGALTKDLPNIPTQQAQMQIATYTNFSIATYLYAKFSLKSLEIRQSAATAIRNLAAEPIVNKSVPQIMNEISGVIGPFYPPEILNQLWSESLQAIGSLVGVGFGTSETNGFESRYGTVKPTGPTLFFKQIIDAKFVKVNPTNSTLVILAGN